ncbi:13128_t:CDS:1, partial [Dentiscutata heterogama]
LDGLYQLNNQLVCISYYKTYYKSLEYDDPQSQEYYQTGLKRGTLVNCKICNHQKSRARMHRIESIQEELWFCELEH